MMRHLSFQPNQTQQQGIYIIIVGYFCKYCKNIVLNTDLFMYFLQKTFLKKKKMKTAVFLIYLIIQN